MGDAGPKRPPPAQLPLELPVAERLRRDDFLPAPANVAALAMIDRWPDWPSSALLLLGPAGSGKSHLAALWARAADAQALAPDCIFDAHTLAERRPRALLLDALDDVADETALFHLMNFCHENNVSLLMTARSAPSAERIRLPDLLSRLRRAPRIEIGSPDDDLFRAVLEKLFLDRQLSVDPSVIAYLSVRLERSLAAARAFVCELDREALARGRAVTRPLAAEVLGRLGTG